MTLSKAAECRWVSYRQAKRIGLRFGSTVIRSNTTRDATVDESLAAAAPDTQFSRALRELGVNLILAGSPQAKGRVERCNGTLQDRLVNRRCV